jgi:hypothetical protein
MDVHAGQAGLTGDPSATSVFQRSDLTGQGQLFTDALYPTYGDTDKIQAVGNGYRRGRRKSANWLKAAVVVTAIAVLVAGTALGLVRAGVIGKSGAPGTTGAAAPKHTAVTTPKTPLLTAASTGAGTASYRIDVVAYTVTVATTTGRSWVSIAIAGQHPIFEGILAPGTSQHEVLLGSSQIDVGAGGTKVIVSSNHRSVTLTPPSAPFNYQFTPKA